MSEEVRTGEWRAWLLGAAGRDATMRFPAPIDIPGWDEQPWVELRPLTVREALRRDSIGITDEYELAANGHAIALRRRYDLEAMAAFDLEHGIVGYLLPMQESDGNTRAVHHNDRDAPRGGQLLDCISMAMLEWLVECAEAVNMRRPGDAPVLDAAKKG